MFDTIRAKLIALVAFFMSFVFLGILVTTLTISSQESDAVVINLAGKQRMLSQKMTKEILMAANGNIAYDGVLKTVNKFDEILNGLIRGNEKLKLPATENLEIVADLNSVNSIWSDFKKNIENISKADPTSQSFKDSFDFITKNNTIILQKMDSIVSKYEAESSQKVTNLKYYMVLFFLFSLVLGIVSIVSLKSQLFKPLHAIVNAAEKIASGNTDFTLKVLKKDEISVLRTSFNKMIHNIHESNEALRAEKAGVERKVEEAIYESEKGAKYLSESTKLMLSQMDKFANGDLTVKLNVSTRDDIGLLFEGFNKTVDNISNILAHVKDSIEATSNASDQISSSSEQMAAGAHEQEAQAQEIAQSVEQMTNTIVDTNRITVDVATKAKLAEQIAIDGGKIVKETMEGMNQISVVVDDASKTVIELGSNSDKISEIVQVIDDIADQTNLLALNAAIEAARAGEQGRGFAVVADEVRRLADRTTKATGEIGIMIKKIQEDTSKAVISMEAGSKKVNEGKVLAQKAENALQQIISSSNSVLNEVEKVAVASEEQTKTAEDISQSIIGITTVTRETSIGIQDLAKSSENLNVLTDDLQKLVLQFKVNENRNTRYLN